MVITFFCFVDKSCSCILNLLQYVDKTLGAEAGRLWQQPSWERMKAHAALLLEERVNGIQNQTAWAGCMLIWKRSVHAWSHSSCSQAWNQDFSHKEQNVPSEFPIRTEEGSSCLTVNPCGSKSIDFVLLSLSWRQHNKISDSLYSSFFCFFLGGGGGGGGGGIFKLLLLWLFLMFFKWKCNYDVTQ